MAYDAPAPRLAGDLIEAVHVGLTAAALHGVDDLAVVLRSTFVTNACSVADAALALTASRLGRATRPIVSYCLRQAQTAPAVAQVAAAVGVTRKTVAARLAAEGLPPASALVGWGRVLLAARWLEDAGRPVESVALALGFDGGAGLHHMLSRYTGLRATEVRARGGLAAVLPLFATAMEGGRRDRRLKTRAAVLWCLPLVFVHAATTDWDWVLAAVLPG